MGQNKSITKIAITGNTKLTLKSMQAILQSPKFEILYVFGISQSNMVTKTNAVNMESFCNDNNIILDKSENWDNLYDFCKSHDIDCVITLGDSRIVPANIVSEFEVIGNHGAVLPDVQGGASLVWGRMLNTGSWGISIMRLGVRVDSGDILKIKRFSYDKISEEEFTEQADDLTVEALIQVLNKDFIPFENKHWSVRVAKHTDSFDAINIMRHCMENNIPIYMPPRKPSDGKVKDTWPDDFVESFKIANDKPYPKWT